MKKISLIFLALVLCFAMTACGGAAVEQDTPTKAVESFLTAVKENNSADIEKLYQGDAETFSMDPGEEGESGLSPEVEKLLLEKLTGFESKVLNEEIKEDKATVEVEIKTYDIAKVFEELMSELLAKAMSDPEIMNADDEAIEKMMMDSLAAKLKELKEKTYVNTVKLELVKADDMWQIVDLGEESPFHAAISGGMFEMSGGGGGDDEEEAA